jgi:hypothetical protein
VLALLTEQATKWCRGVVVLDLTEGLRCTLSNDSILICQGHDEGLDRASMPDLAQGDGRTPTDRRIVIQQRPDQPFYGRRVTDQPQRSGRPPPDDLILIG